MGLAVQETKENKNGTTDMVEEPKIKAQQSEFPAGELPVYYIKSNYYRVIHVDGIYGGGTPTPGNIMMTVFNHKMPIPERAVNDAQGKEIREKRVVKYGIENEAEVSLVMDLNTARIVHQWLDSTIKNTEALLQGVQLKQQK